MNRKNVLVLFGGCSPEHEISRNSAATIIANLPEDRYNVMPVYITAEGKWLLYDGSIDNIKNVPWEKFGTPAILSPDRVNRGLLRIVGEKVKYLPVDVAFPVLHGANGEDGAIQGLFELSGIPYVGCGVLASAVSMDKAVTKVIISSIGIEQAAYYVLTAADIATNPNALKGLKQSLARKGCYPCFVKPANAGSSVGITRVKDKKELEPAIEKALMFDRKIVIEQGIDCRELECAVLGADHDVEASVVGEIVPSDDFYSFDAKYNSSASKTLVPADISEEISDEVRKQAVAIFKALGCRGMARVDFFLEKETNKIYFNEINTIPGFTSISMYPMLWQHCGVELPVLLDRLLQIALG